MMVSTGWDATVRVWNAIATTTAKETINLCSDGKGFIDAFINLNYTLFIAHN